MTFPILGGNGAVAGYSIDNSLRFNDGDNPYLSKTFGSTGNRKIFTLSTWFKLGHLNTGDVNDNRYIIDNQGVSGGENPLVIGSDLKIRFSLYNGSSDVFSVTSNNILRDPSAFYHILLKVDTTQSTSADRVRIYLNGVEISYSGSTSYPSQNYDLYLNTTSYPTYIGRFGQSTGRQFDGYLAEYHFIDGTAKSPTDFGEYDEDSGIWKPIQYTGSYGTNGFYLDFENSGSLGTDQSGNDNNFTPTNLASTDQTTDTPTNNFATINALANYYNPATLSEGNLRVDFASGVDTVFNISTMGVSTGKWYCEIKAVTIPDYAKIGIASRPCIAGGNSDNLSAGQYNYGYSASNGNVDSNNTAGGDGGTYIGYGATWDDGDIIGIGLDLDNNRLYFSKNGTWQNSANPSAGTGGVVIADPTSTQDGVYYFGVGDNRNDYATRMDCNFGNPPFSISSGNSDGNGYGNFEYAPPSGYLALCTQNLATELSPTIDDGSEYFNTIFWTGNSVDDRSITGVGFAPDLVSIKNRGLSTNFYWYDTTRGADNQLLSNATNAESTITNKLQAFESDGFQLGTSSEVNASSYSYVGWSWKANGGTTSSNTDGSITSTVQANTTAGFSIVTYTGTGATATFGHGLGAVPKMVIIKDRDAVKNWTVYHNKTFNNRSTFLNLNDGQTAPTDHWQNTTPTSSIVYIGDYSHINTSGNDYVAYCFAEIEGYSKISSFEGNNSTDGSYVYTGFRPQWVLIKSIDSSDHWNIPAHESFLSSNGTVNFLSPNLSNGVRDMDQNPAIDFLSNGFKLRTSDNNLNGSLTYIYYAIASNPFVTSNSVPVTAR